MLCFAIILRDCFALISNFFEHENFFEPPPEVLQKSVLEICSSFKGKDLRLNVVLHFSMDLLPQICCKFTD